MQEGGQGVFSLFSRARRGQAGERLLATIVSGRPISDKVVVVTAHPDDEVIGMGANMAHFHDLTLLQLSDGAPLDQSRIEEAGFKTKQDYADARREEVLHALQVCAPHLARFSCLGLIDGQLVDQIATIVRQLESDLLAADAVFTHPFEGGHIDHDVAAFCVQTACERLRARGCKTPLRYEFASYHNDAGMLRTGEFWFDADCLEVETHLSPAMLWRRETAFACHRSQTDNLRAFNFRGERFRVAPVYDFERAPPPGLTLYGAAASAKLVGAVRAYRQAEQRGAHLLAS